MKPRQEHAGESGAAVRGGLLRGRIAYLDSAGSTVGEEHFELIRQDCGGSLRALCELNAVGVLRDVSMTFDGSGIPVDGFCRVTDRGRPAGSSWFSFQGDTVHVESQLQGRGRISQRFSNDPQYVYLGLHPLQGDALTAMHADHQKPGEFVTVRGLTNSVSENGDEGLYAQPVSIDIAYLGEAELEVIAGSFPARRYQLRWHPDWPPAELWVRKSDCLFLRLQWPQVSTRYELAMLENPRVSDVGGVPTASRQWRTE